MKRILLLALALILLFSATACDLISYADSMIWPKTPTPSVKTPSPNEVTGNVPTPTLKPSSTPSSNRLLIWLPPEMDPGAETEAAKLLKNRLDSFANERGISISVRLKANNGPGSMLEALGAAKAAAPEALPHLVVLNDSDLRCAAQAALIYPSQSFTSILRESDWYAYARSLGNSEGQAIGLPFLGDPLVMAYDSELLDRRPPDEWEAIRMNIGRVGFAADDPQGRFLLLLYLNAGGKILDEEDGVLELEALTAALRLLREAEMTNHISDSSLQIQTPEQVWQGFNSWKFHYGIMPASSVLDGMKETQARKIVPTLTDPLISLTGGWAWAVTAMDVQRQEIAQDLAAYLVESEFLAAWSEAMQVLPARPSSLGAWAPSAIKASFEEASKNAVILPPKDVMDRIGPVLRNATILIVRDHANPEETAKQAVESLK